MFALKFVGRSDLLTRQTLALLAVEPGLLLGLLVYDPTGGAIIEQVPKGSTISTTGPLFPIHVAYSYLLVAVATGLLMRAAIRTRQLYV